MKPFIKSKRNASFSYGLGVAQIVAGIPVVFLSLLMISVVFSLLKNYNALYYFPQILLMVFFGGGVFLIYNGVSTCKLVSNYQKLVSAMQYRNRENIRLLAGITGQSLTKLVRDLNKMADKGFFPDSHVDLMRCEFVLEADNRPDSPLSDGAVFLTEKKRRPLTALLAVPAIMAAYQVLHPYRAWYDLFIALAIAAAVSVTLYVNSRKVSVIKEEVFKALPPAEPPAIKTGNEALDEFLTSSMTYLNELNGLALSITNEKMILPMGELLNITRQILAFVEKQPEKIRQIRQFMNYYLPTTIRLLKSYGDFSGQQLKGDNIKEAMAKIEESMGGIVETFRRELDNLYLDKAVDISVDIDVMLAMMRKQGISDDLGDKDKEKRIV